MDLEILLSRRAYDSFRHLLRSSHARERWICVEADGSLTSGEEGTAATSTNVTVGWASTDTLYGGSSGTFFPQVEQCRRLRWLQSAFSGADLPIYRSLVERGVRITTSHENAISIAEYVLGAVLRHFQGADEWREAQRARKWQHHEFPEVHGTTWLVIGMGAIGTEVARRVGAMGARVIGVRRTPTGREPVDRMCTPAQTLSALPSADVVVLALSASTDTHHLVNGDFLSRMKRESVLVNVARGSLVDESALLSSLAHGVPATAILDVFEKEPLPDRSPLWAHPRVVVTPHASSGGLGRHARNARLFRRNLDAFSEGRALENVLVPQRLAEPGEDAPAQFKV